MARRRIGQEDLIPRPEPRAASSLSELAALLDWAEVDRALAGISAEAKGEPGWPPLALFRGLLLATWHDLSDIKLTEALDDESMQFRRGGFLGFRSGRLLTRRVGDMACAETGVAGEAGGGEPLRLLEPEAELGPAGLLVALDAGELGLGRHAELQLRDQLHPPHQLRRRPPPPP
jgi:hypothetical protein